MNDFADIGLSLARWPSRTHCLRHDAGADVVEVEYLRPLLTSLLMPPMLTIMTIPDYQYGQR